MTEKDVQDIEALGFKEVQIQNVRVGDEVAYYPTMFGFNMDKEPQIATVTAVEGPDTSSGYPVWTIHHTGLGSPGDADQGCPVWVRRQES